MRFKNYINYLLIIFYILATATPAWADSINFGIASRCDTNKSLFELIGVVEANGKVTYATPSPKGLNRLSLVTRTLSCKINGKQVHASIRVFGGTSGHCMGGGYVDITNLQIGKQKISVPEPGEAFNWSCVNQPMLVRLSIHANASGGTIERCTTADWTWEDGYFPIQCSLENLH